MKKKGSITVFLALVLSVLLSLVATSIQSVQAAAARTQILNGLDIGLYSLFGQYDRSLLKDYDLFFLDGAQGGTELDLAAVYDNMESYMKPVLKQNSQKLRIKQGGFTGYRLATDQNGEVFYHQAVSYMKDTLSGQGVQALLNRLKDREEKTKQAETDGKTAENGGTLENYDSEMNGAFNKSQEQRNFPSPDIQPAVHRQKNHRTQFFHSILLIRSCCTHAYFLPATASPVSPSASVRCMFPDYDSGFPSK
jgi:hypothetical protein